MIRGTNEFLQDYARSFTSLPHQKRMAAMLYLRELEQGLSAHIFKKTEGLPQNKTARKFLTMAMRAPTIEDFQAIVEAELKRNRGATLGLSETILDWLKDQGNELEKLLEDAHTNAEASYKSAKGRGSEFPLKKEELTTRDLMKSVRHAFVVLALRRLV